MHLPVELQILLFFVAVVALVLALLGQLTPDPARQRLLRITRPPGTQLPPPSQAARPQNTAPAEPLPRWAAPLAKLSLPQGPWERSPLRLRLVRAGLRGPHAAAAFFAAKTMLTFALPTVVVLALTLSGLALSPQVAAGLVVVVAASGYFAPNLYLGQRIARNQQEVFEHFPDAIDLMTVCVEAGLGLDAALTRVGDELGLISPRLAEELHLVNLELRAGASREQALRNLALRTGSQEVDLLVSMLVQSDRFGTGVAQALRVHSDSLRTKRRQLAEERAAKIPVKLLFPMIFCIFPSMLLVLLGPAFISIYRVLVPVMSGEPPQP